MIAFDRSRSRDQSNKHFGRHFVTYLRNIATYFNKIDHSWPLITREAAWTGGYNFGSVCLSVCQTITFESLDTGRSFSHIRFISREYGSSSYTKVIGSRSRSQEQKIHISQCKTSICNNSSFINHRTVMFSCSVGFSDMADRMVWLPCHAYALADGRLYIWKQSCYLLPRPRDPGDIFKVTSSKSSHRHFQKMHFTVGSMTRQTGRWFAVEDHLVC